MFALLLVGRENMGSWELEDVLSVRPEGCQWYGRRPAWHKEKGAPPVTLFPARHFPYRIAHLSVAPVTAPTSIKKDSIREVVAKDFPNYVPKVIANTLNKATFIKSSVMRARLQELTEYYMVERRPVQGEFMALTCEYYVKPPLNEELMDKIKVLATTMELIQTYYYFWDDLEDGAKVRCGKPCWHLRPDTGLLALNDACLIRSLINETIEQNFDGELRQNLLYVYNRNDVIDICIAEGTVTGKTGTDIQEGKCSWPAVTVLQKCSPEQRRVFEENYGSWEPERAARIHELYKELDIINLYREEVASRRDVFFRKVNALPKSSTPSAEFFIELYNFFDTFTKDLTLMYDNH
ncbi:unnamed protein product, partial [Iphiclides podalirius]